VTKFETLLDCKYEKDIAYVSKHHLEQFWPIAKFQNINVGLYNALVRAHNKLVEGNPACIARVPQQGANFVVL
jgi:hypothetical protein